METLAFRNFVFLLTLIITGATMVLAFAVIVNIWLKKIHTSLLDKMVHLSAMVVQQHYQHNDESERG